MIDSYTWFLLFSLLIVTVLAIFCPTESEKEAAEIERYLKWQKAFDEERELKAVENICYDAFRLMSDDEFARLPESLKGKVPDKCSFCRWMLICDPIEMALATGEYCGGFKERRKQGH